MRKLLFTATLSLAAAFAAPADVPYYIGTYGDDTYEDGSYVLDGEFYALVWSKGSAFSGFNADATPVDPKDVVVVARPYAKDRCCEYFQHQVKDAEDAKYVDGTFHIVLLDTRSADGTLPGGGKDRQLEVVNGYGVVKSTPYALFSKAKALYIEDAIGANTVSAVPSYAPQPPVVTGVAVRDGQFVMTVTNTASYLRYKAAGVKVGGVPVPTAASTAADGQKDANQPIEISVPVAAAASNGFFRVIRK